MVRWNMSRKDMTPTELTEHKRVVKQQSNQKYYNTSKDLFNYKLITKSYN